MIGLVGDLEFKVEVCRQDSGMQKRAGQGVSGQGMAEKRGYVNKPGPAKSEEEMANKIDHWLEIMNFKACEVVKALWARKLLDTQRMK